MPELQGERAGRMHAAPHQGAGLVRYCPQRHKGMGSNGTFGQAGSPWQGYGTATD